MRGRSFWAAGLKSLLAFLAVVLSILYAISSTGEGAPVRADARGASAYRRPLLNDPVTLDPARINDIYGRTIANQIFDGLVQFDGVLAIRPAIAETWTASRDGLVWTFKLKKGVKFHHGREVSAEDFVYSFTRIIDPKTKSAGASLFMKIRGADEFAAGRASRVEGLVAVDPHTLQITLEESQTPFVASLAVGFAKVVPREVVERLGEEFGRQPVGSGPFKFVEWIRDKRITLAANPDYFEGRPKLDRLEYRIFTGEALELMFAEFERGNLEDSAFPIRERPRFLSGRQYQFVRRPILGISFLGMNTSLKPLDDVRVRQAINYAIDRRTIMREIYQDQYLPGVGILPPGTYGYDPRLSGYAYDPKKAASLLTAAGYPGGQGIPVLHIWSARKNEEALAEHDAIVKYLAAIGIRAEVHYNTNWPEYKSQVYEGKLPIFRYSWYADTPDPETFLGQLFDSHGSDNTTAFRSRTVDILLQRARLETNVQKKLQLYQDVEREIVNQAPLVVLSYYSYERLFQPYVKGVQVSAM
ncbi:MAG TPA: ABC transporter substrate-binding protein, partial [Candidatus Sulfotelmatobacter sp.]|nr:ABC transporter substrate-binding protein [Candidatus Sulfotelmatobacter sp.]